MMGAKPSTAIGWWREWDGLVPTWIASTQEVYVLQAPSSKRFRSPNRFITRASYHVQLWTVPRRKFRNLQSPWQREPAFRAPFVQKELITWGSTVGTIHLNLLLRPSFSVLFGRLPSVLRKRGYKWPASGPNNNLIEWRFIKTVPTAPVVSGMEKEPRGFWFSTISLTSIYKAELSSGNPQNRAKWWNCRLLITGRIMRSHY